LKLIHSILRLTNAHIAQAADGAGGATTSTVGLDVSDFDAMIKQLEEYDAQREVVIKKSRDVGKAAKQAIYSLHRGDDTQAQARIAAATATVEEVLPLVQNSPSLRHGSFAGAMEELAEAVIFRGFLQEGRLLARSEASLCDIEEYLGGVLDFTGELNRYAVARATTRDVAAVQSCRDLVEAIFGQFIRMDLRNGALRKKFDALKYTLKKMEQTLYELSLTEAGLPTKLEEELAPEPAAAGAGPDDV
jgi:predicted translin family RNA/ssDNA-binding protein